MTRALSRLGLGTVQFGQAYGVSNARGQVPLDEVGAILKRAAEVGMRTLDTAANYGEAEAVLGALAEATKPFRLVTKTASIRGGIDAVIARARQSVDTVRRKTIDLLLVHAASDLLGADGQKLWQSLLALRDEGLFGGIGISCYVADDPVAVARSFRPAAMQVPCSLLDQRLLQSGALAAIKDMDVEIHARSIYLQGLLFLPEDRLPAKLKHAAPELAAIRARIAKAGTTPLEAALAFVLDRPEIDVAVVGVTSLAELDEIIAAAQKPAPVIDWQACALDDETVLTPSRW